MCCFFKSYSVFTFVHFLNFLGFLRFLHFCYCESSQNKPLYTAGYLSSVFLLLSSLNQTKQQPTLNYIIRQYRKGLKETFHTNRTVELVALFLQEVLAHISAVYQLSWLSFIVIFLSSYMCANTWQLINIIFFHILPYSSHHLVLHTVTYWQPH